MTANRTTSSPLDDLRSLVQELRNRCASVENTSAIFDRIDDSLADAEQRRNRSESIIASALDAFVAMDAQGRITEWNRQAELIFGWPRDEALGRTVAETIVPVQHRETHVAGLTRFLATGAGVVLNQRLVMSALRRDGSEFPAELTLLEPQRIGDTFVFHAFIRDITRLVDVAESLRSSESLYHSLVDRLPINVTRKDLAGRITFVNRPFCELVGRTEDELVGKTDHDLSPPEMAEKYIRDDRQVAETCQVFHAIEENRLQGRASYFEVWKIPVQDPSGKVIETQAVFWDVTEREENRIALARERDLLRTLMDSLPDLIYVKDAASRYVTVNRSLLQMWGVSSPENIVGKTAFDFVPEELAGRYTSKDNEVLRQDHAVIDFEELVLTPTGERRVYSVTKVPLHDPLGQVSGLVGIDRDITQRKRTEEELRQARLAADSANQAKSDFLANMSHEIRTPLNAVIGITDLLLAGEMATGQREYLEIVRDSGESLMIVINDILDFSKIEAGQLHPESLAYNLPDTLGGAMKALAMRAHAKGIELACDIGSSVPELVQGDPNLLRQVITNLIGNAIKFTLEGEVVLRVRQIAETAHRVEIRFQVRDTGIGIPADKVDHVFMAFAQADASTTRRFGGTGLGLAISTRLVKAMGGMLEVRSEVGVGSEFFFDLLFPKADTADVDKLPQHRDILARRSALVVDDNETNRLILREMLQSFGMTTITVADAEAALTALGEAHRRGEPIELVLTDINMPDVDGFMLAERIRQQTAWLQPIILALTSGPRPNDEIRSRQLKLAAHLMKPVKRSELCRALIAALSPAASTETVRPETTPFAKATRPLHVLLAEDGRMNQVLAVGVLNREGHSVTIANDGREAVAAFQANKFDLILMDIEMPELDGFQATAAIRQIESTSGGHIPILSMTAHALSGDRERCLAAGMDGYLSKPIRIKDLIRAIAELTPDSGLDQESVR